MKSKTTAGITSFSVPIYVQDTSSTTGGGLAGLTESTPGLVAEYRRRGQSSWTSFAIVSTGKTLGTYVSGGLVADGSLAGAYELDIPNAAVATGARWVHVRLRGAANMFPVLIEIHLDAIDYQTDVATAVWSATTRSLTTFGTLAADTATAVWSAATRTLTAIGDSSGVTTLLSRVVGTLAAGTHNPQSGDAFARLGAPAGASIAADLAAIPAAVWSAATRTLTVIGDSSGVTTLLSRVVGTLAAGTHNPQSGDAFARLGAPAGASIAADLATITTNVLAVSAFVDTEVAAIKTVTDKLNTTLELSGANYRYTAAALALAPAGGGGGGGTDWTADQRTALSTILGIPSSGTTPTGTTLAAILSAVNSISTSTGGGSSETGTIATAMAGPLSASADGVTVTGHNLADLIEAEKYLAKKNAKNGGMKFQKIIPGAEQ